MLNQPKILIKRIYVEMTVLSGECRDTHFTQPFLSCLVVKKRVCVVTKDCSALCSKSHKPAVLPRCFFLRHYSKFRWRQLLHHVINWLKQQPLLAKGATWCNWCLDKCECDVTLQSRKGRCQSIQSDAMFMMLSRAWESFSVKTKTEFFNRWQGLGPGAWGQCQKCFMTS